MKKLLAFLLLVSFNARADIAPNVTFTAATTWHEKSISVFGPDGLGYMRAMKLNTSGQLSVADVGVAVASGSVAGYSSIHKFAEAPDIDTADGFVSVWGSDANTSKTYTYSASADIDSISSSDDTDTQDVKIFGLDASYEVVEQTVTLTGQTRVALGTPLMRVYRMANVGPTDMAGTVYCYVNGAITLGVPDTAGDIRALIINGNNQTLMSMYTVPAGKTAYLTGFFSSMSRKVAAISTVRLLIRPVGEVFQIKEVFSLNSVGTSGFDITQNPPMKIEAKSDIEWRANTDANNIGVSVSYDLILVDN